MNLLQLQNGWKQYGVKVLFENAGFSINLGEHVGVIGPNGAGKTTLFKAIVGQLELDQGTFTKSTQLRLGYLEQEADWDISQTVENFLSSGHVKQLWELKQLGLSLGLTEEIFSRPIHLLSGGYRMRVKLLSLLGMEPNLLLLDEPTNFLDLESVIALEQFLQNYEGAFLLISHDREFLRRVTDHTLEVEGGDITKFPGNIDDYFEQKEEWQRQTESRAANLEAKRKHLQAFVDRFRAKATKAKQAQSRMKMIEKMEKIELGALPIKARINIPKPTPTGKETLVVEKGQLGYEVSKPILQNVDFRLLRGQHLGVVGVNGAGKSTLLKSLAGRLPLLHGSSQLGYQVKISYFAQHSSDELHNEETVLQALQRMAHPEVLAQDILNLAGSLLFSGEAIEKKVKVLSGGEKSRVALGQVLLQKNPVLLLDEPTNHLDFETVEALTRALSDFEGSLVVVSHDRSFIRRVANQILEIRDGQAEFYPGTYDDYVWSLEKGALSQRNLSQASVSGKTTSGPITKLNYKEERKRLESLVTLEKRKIREAEAQMKTLETERDQKTISLIAAKGSESAKLAKELSLVSQKIAELESQMLESMEAQERAEKDLHSLVSNSAN